MQQGTSAQQNLELVDEFCCMACLELPTDPVTLPCGNSVCLRCLRPTDTLDTYKCPVSICGITHQYRLEKPNIMLQNCLTKIFPQEYKALELCKMGEAILDKFAQSELPVCSSKQGCEMQISSFDKKSVIDLALRDFFDPAIHLAPYLQLPFFLRAKAYAEIGEFESAMQDAGIVIHLNMYSKRGLIIDAFIKKKQELESQFQNNAGKEKTFCSVRSRHKSNTPISLGLLKARLTKRLENLNVNVYNLLNVEDVTCNLCLSAVFDPVTSPCGHTWCRSCIIRSHEFSNNCPLCRVVMPQAGYFVKRPRSIAIDGVVGKLLEHQDITPLISPIQPENRNLPLFICSLAFPGSTTSLHVFEPKYRVLDNVTLR